MLPYYFSILSLQSFNSAREALNVAMLMELVERWAVDFDRFSRQDHVTCDWRRGWLPWQRLDPVDVCLEQRLHLISRKRIRSHHEGLLLRRLTLALM